MFHVERERCPLTKVAFCPQRAGREQLSLTRGADGLSVGGTQ